MTKVDIISGFLGAGKTTFIKLLIENVFAGEKLVLIENEFGEIGIDGGFLKDAGIEITEMNSGCICCSLVGDFGAALKQVLTVYNDASSVSMWLDTVFGQNIGNALNEGVVNMMAGQGSAQDIVKGVETAAAKG